MSSHNTSVIDENRRWSDLRCLTDRASIFASSGFDPGIKNLKEVHKMPVLVVGAGGLGCEILKDLALSGFHDIDIIDMDTIDLSNLNRQFLFRENDIGRSKAEVAAAFVEKRVFGCKVTPHNCKIQDKSPEFYRKFFIIICGLDSIEARRWLNATVCSLVGFDDGNNPKPNTIVPLIDGGTEGFKGNSRVIIPFMTPCIQCTIDLYTPQVNFPLCTIAHTPRLPEHCVEYVKVVLWEKEKPFGQDVKLDADDPAHVEWAFRAAQQRANEYEIKDVDLRLTQGVLKRIIPAVASTNAIIAGSCALEALKLASNISCPLNNYLNFANVEGICFNVVALERDPECLVCGQKSVQMYSVREDCTLSGFLDDLKDKYQLQNPSIRAGNTFLYEINTLMPEMETASRKNLCKTLKELHVTEDSELLVADEALTKSIVFRIKYSK